MAYTIISGAHWGEDFDWIGFVDWIGFSDWGAFFESGNCKGFSCGTGGSRWNSTWTAHYLETRTTPNHFPEVIA